MPEALSEILESTEHTLLATDLGDTEGPLWHPGGYLTFVDMTNSRVASLGLGSRYLGGAGEHRRGQRLHAGLPRAVDHVRRGKP